MKKEYGNKLKTLYRKNWLLFFFSLILLFTGILCFQTLYIEISVIGLILCCISIYFICYMSDNRCSCVYFAWNSVRAAGSI